MDLHPNPDKPEITNFKHQITNKNKNQLFGILNFSHCDLFVICFLIIVIYFYVFSVFCFFDIKTQKIRDKVLT